MNTPAPRTLRELRSAAGFCRQEDLAAAIGVTTRSVSRWETGAVQPPPSLRQYLQLRADRAANPPGARP